MQVLEPPGTRQDLHTSVHKVPKQQLLGSAFPHSEQCKELRPVRGGEHVPAAELEQGALGKPPVAGGGSGGGSGLGGSGSGWQWVEWQWVEWQWQWMGGSGWVAVAVDWVD
jgi:hypothetical protein